MQQATKDLPARRTRPRIFDNRITIRVTSATKDELARMGHNESRKFTVFCRTQIETALVQWRKSHPRK